MYARMINLLHVFVEGIIHFSMNIEERKKSNSMTKVVENTEADLGLLQHPRWSAL